MGLQRWFYAGGRPNLMARLLDRGTAAVSARGIARVLCRFDGYRGRYVFHCHNLEHEDMMMANFEVV